MKYNWHFTIPVARIILIVWGNCSGFISLTGVLSHLLCPWPWPKDKL